MMPALLARKGGHAVARRRWYARLFRGRTTMASLALRWSRLWRATKCGVRWIACSQCGLAGQTAPGTAAAGCANELAACSCRQRTEGSLAIRRRRPSHATRSPAARTVSWSPGLPGAIAQRPAAAATKRDAGVCSWKRQRVGRRARPSGAAIGTAFGCATSRTAPAMSAASRSRMCSWRWTPAHLWVLMALLFSGASQRS
mmetsp:Transcript_49142/g.113880  ORF Transcript_49142/g.113880 Transcript_49142/m.113880 type:complete len:200 (+) Transcript_49142:259-858(+)